MVGLVLFKNLSSSAKWGYYKKAAIRKPGRGAPRTTEFVGTLILDFQDFKTERNKYLLFKPPSLRYFVIAEWTA